ncbi:hypothetical protein DAPPUDRAFT_301187 [Daphnia pulex]|uniref:E3 ubiquitin-protein ligase n=1 Tax=Daphnia pulex TaxID=6669 RepID=E9HGP8_DAPPU|nr:hypothetical protein DAPPUDRAFT_301187 [Daphnia pulex]|eukprot:EFX69003.1 hypothetical protein DAPPUDRAFT_301187 [Daphnia pulex]
MAVHVQQYVVVWECLSRPNSSHWKAYSPAVSQILEKAYQNKLTQVLLGDADPSLSRFRISLTSMTQICEVREEASPVRRMLYPRSSTAGQGIRWDWLGDRFSEWNEYSMEAQVAIEKAWSSGLQTLDLSKTCCVPYIINYCNLTQVRKDTGFVRSIRRVQQATYPAALKHEVPLETVPQPAVKPEQETVKSSGSSVKPNWLSNMIMNVVKSPSKGSGDQKSQKLGRNSAEQSSDDCPQDSSSNRKRKESRIALRVERRMSRSSSLDTVSTCLSQDSIKPPQNSARSTNAY